MKLPGPTCCQPLRSWPSKSCFQPSCLAGANDDIAVPSDVKKVDWEAEIACVISKRGKRIKGERALDHVAGWMTTNDVSARDLQIRTDRPGLRSDWLNGKSHDKFAPMGPFLVPKAFVADHMKLFIRLTLNGAVKQNGNTSQFIFTPEEQIEYASDILSVETGDIFVCGTCGGVGQGTHTFINVGDVADIVHRSDDGVAHVDSPLLRGGVGLVVLEVCILELDQREMQLLDQRLDLRNELL